MSIALGGRRLHPDNTGRTDNEQTEAPTFAAICRGGRAPTHAADLNERSERPPRSLNGSPLSHHTAAGASAPRSSRVLVLSHSPESARFVSALRAVGLTAGCAHLGAEGLEMARRDRFDLVIVDLDPAGTTAGLELVRTLRTGDEHLRVIVLGDPASMPAAIAAAPTAHVLRTPLGIGEMMAWVHAALLPYRPPPAYQAPHRMSLRTPGSSAERWASYVLRAIDAAIDLRTVTRWATHLAVSRFVLCECCRLVDVPTHHARDFSRMLRAVCRSGDQWQPEAVLDLGDVRTLNKLLAQSGLPRRAAHVPTVAEFLARQRWIHAGNPGLAALRTLLFDV